MSDMLTRKQQLELALQNCYDVLELTPEDRYESVLNRISYPMQRYKDELEEIEWEMSRNY
jgi:hypothetical protein